MEQSVQELCWLLQEVLFEKQHDFQITDSERLYTIAKENGLSGTVFEVIKAHGVTDVAYTKFQKDFFKYVAQDEEQLRTIELIEGLLNANNIKHVFLKGSILKNIYPKTYMRAMGDIDFLIQEKDRKLVQDLFDRLDIELKSSGFVHDYYKTESKLSVEAHVRLTMKKEECVDLENIEAIVKKQKNKYEIELLYLLYHIKKHLLTSGIGLRSVIDIGIYLNHHSEHLDVGVLYEILDRNGLTKLYENLALFSERYLGVTYDILIENRTLSDELLNSFTDYIVLSGIHGLGLSFNSFTGLVSSQRDTRFPKFKSLLKIVFLSYSDLNALYPRTVKCRLLLPLGYVLRVFDFLFKHRKRRRYKLKQLLRMNENVNQTQKVFDELGI